MGKGFSIQGLKETEKFRWVLPDDLGVLQSLQILGNSRVKSATESDAQWEQWRYCRKAIPFFSAQETPRFIAWPRTVRRKGSQGKAMAVWFDADIDLFPFLALWVTLMEGLGSISQYHERIGSKKHWGKTPSGMGESSDYWFRKKSAKQIKPNTSWELSVGRGLSRILHCPIWWLLATCGYFN